LSHIHCSDERLLLNEQSSTYLPDALTSPVKHAMRMFARDFEAVLGSMPVFAESMDDAAIVIRYAEAEDLLADRPEAFAFRFDRKRIHIVGRDDLGLVYGILEFSRRYLGIQPFWFWMDQAIERRDGISVPCENYDSPPSKVRFRGWFVNDEVCLIGWKEQYPPGRDIWQPVFETLLRCGGNMVIPGTDLPKSGEHAKIAQEMGLWVTHHHAEPLGAEMFLRAYPGKMASYREEPELFERLWQEAIEKQKRDNIVWVLSFRGQGDKPFWENDPSFDTPQKRGAMISKVVRRQYDMIREEVDAPVCCVALYGEIAELYKGGFIELPSDVIKVWADNGYGRMVSRRHGSKNLRIPALPALDDKGKHGIYYHVTFHDLQASNHLAMFSGSSAFVEREVKSAFQAGATEYLLLNCGNIRQHVYMLDLISQMWRMGDVESDDHLRSFVQNYYPSNHEEMEELYLSYSKASIMYGPNEDDVAGDEFYHHPARILIGHWLQGKAPQTCKSLVWATGEADFDVQVRWFMKRCEEGAAKWGSWLERCDLLIAKLEKTDKQRAIDHLRYHGVLHQSGAEGFLLLSRAYFAYCEGQYPQAFVLASQSMRAYSRGLETLRGSEHGKWEHFHRADWLTNIASTVNNVDTLRRWLRMHGDSPDFFLWYKEFLMPETEKHIYLENTHRNPLSDDELAERLGQYFGLA